MIPHPNNSCGGNHSDWLEVMLTSKCNGSCSWCVEKDGYRPKKTASWQTIVEKAVSTKKKNIILLGGEPTLYPDLNKVITGLRAAGKHIYITTNGSNLKPLLFVQGLNISIHHNILELNRKITGIDLSFIALENTIEVFKKQHTTIRLNCNLIKGYIDCSDAILEYIEFAKWLGADSVRFAELKSDEANFICAAKIFNFKYGLNQDPFILGCSHDTTINGMSISFRQMCGLQTSLRPRPENPEFPDPKQVLYYDGILYNGWQTKKAKTMSTKELREILKKVQDGLFSVEEATAIIEKAVEGTEENDDRGFCQY